MITLIQVFLLLGTYSRFKERLYVAMMSSAWAAMLAIVFPTPGNLMIPGDVALFWIQHYLTALVVPFILTFYGRYTQSYQLDLRAVLYVNYT
mgnify:FL=1